MLEIVDMNGEGTASSIASKNGFTISVDADSGKKFDGDDFFPLDFDGTSRPWYKAVKTADTLIFTDVYLDVYTNESRIACVAPYYRDNVFAGAVVMSSYLSKLSKLVLDSQTKTCFIIDKNGKILFSKDETGKMLEILRPQQNLYEVSDDLKKIAEQMTAGKNDIMKFSVSDKNYYIAFYPIHRTGWSFATVLDANEIMTVERFTRERVVSFARKNVEDMNDFQLKILVFMAGGMILIFVGIIYMGKRLGNHFAKPILELSDGVRDIASGNLDKKLDIHTGGEIEHLATCFNAMTDELKVYMTNLTRITADKERIATELNVATNIQQSMLPHDFDFDRADFEIYATMTAARRVLMPGIDSSGE